MACARVHVCRVPVRMRLLDDSLVILVAMTPKANDPPTPHPKQPTNPSEIVRELLDFYEFPGDETPIVRGSALAAVEVRGCIWRWRCCIGLSGVFSCGDCCRRPVVGHTRGVCMYLIPCPTTKHSRHHTPHATARARTTTWGRRPSSSSWTRWTRPYPRYVLLSFLPSLRLRPSMHTPVDCQSPPLSPSSPSSVWCGDASPPFSAHAHKRPLHITPKNSPRVTSTSPSSCRWRMFSPSRGAGRS